MIVSRPRMILSVSHCFLILSKRLMFLRACPENLFTLRADFLFMVFRRTDTILWIGGFVDLQCKAPGYLSYEG